MSFGLLGAPKILNLRKFSVNCLTDPNTLCLYVRSREKMRAVNIFWGTFLLYRPKSRQMDFVMED